MVLSIFGIFINDVELLMRGIVFPIYRDVLSTCGVLPVKSVAFLR